MLKVSLYICLAPGRIDRPLSRVLRDRAAALYFGKKPFAFAQTPSGEKPALCLPAGAQFNLSHSENLFICAFASSPVGVDAERVRAVPRRDALCRRVLEKSAQNEYFAAPEERREALFFRLWTRHEAAVKLSGTGLFGKGAPQKELCFTSLDEYLPDGFAGTLCTREKPRLAVNTFSQA